MVPAVSENASRVIRSYAEAGMMRDAAPMSYLYGSASAVDLQEITTNLTFVRLMQGEALIVPEDEGQVARAADGALWRPMMAEYVAFVCLVNPHFPQGRFDELFAGAAAYYEAHLKALMDDFAMDLEGWKAGFAGCLFIG